MKNTHRQAGFVLIELVSTLILIGIIGTFTGFFLYYGINGFLASKRNSEDALKVQVALDRISAELRDIKSSPKPAFASKKVTYESNTLSGIRILQMENDASGRPGIYLTVDGAKNILLDNLDASKTYDITYDASKDLNNSGDGNNEITFIKVAFSLNDLGRPFEVRIYPRAMITFP
jgi:type II secretory pathway pseudopilin PulG